jgi:CBS domain-containing protein
VLLGNREVRDASVLTSSNKQGGTMKVRDIMTKNPLIIPDGTSVEDAARIMRDEKIGLLPVGDKHNICGVITDRDIVTRVTAVCKDAKHTDVREVLTPDFIYCFSDQDVEDACFLMQDYYVRRLLVFDRPRDLVGVLSLDDVAARGRKDKLAGYALSKVARVA